MSNDKGSGSGSKGIVDRVLDHPIPVRVSTINTSQGPVRLSQPMDLGDTSLRQIFTGRKSED